MSKSDDISKQELAEAAGSHGEVSDQSNRLVVIDEGHPALIREPTLLEQALAKNVSSEQLQQFMDLQERYEANEARKAFNIAMAQFKKDPPKVYKDKQNKQFQMSGYVSIEKLVNTVNKSLSAHNLSVRWTINQQQEITVTCVLSHSQGHSESVSLSAPPDDSGAKNAIQQIKSTITYLKIITFEAVTGVASEASSLNNDGNAPDELTNYISKRRIEQLEELIAAQDDSFRSRVMEWLKGKGIESLDNIPAESFDACLKSIKSSAKISEDLNNADT